MKCKCTICKLQSIGRCSFCGGRLTDVGLFWKKLVCKKCGLPAINIMDCEVR